MTNQYNRIKQIFGHKCTAININGESVSSINVSSREVTLCEAVDLSFKIPLRITGENLICQGAKRSVGFEKNDNQLINEIAGNSNVSESYISNALKTISCLSGIRHINLGLTEAMFKDLRPDLFIMYVQPHIITDLMHNLAKKEIRPFIAPFSFLSICGNILANCYVNKVVSISFGCPESRNKGGIGKEEVVVGLPAKILFELLPFYDQELQRNNTNTP